MDQDDFDAPSRIPPDDVLMVSQDAYEGPLDLLLDLVRAKKVDISAISILSVVDSFLSWMATARSMRLELAADWLVMMANLAFLKSRLLLPTPRDASTDKARAMVEDLAVQLRRREAIRALMESILQRPRIGVQWHAPGATLPPQREGKRLDGNLHALLVAYKREARLTVVPQAAPVRKPFHLMSVEDAISHVIDLGLDRDIAVSLYDLLPPATPTDPMHARSRIAATYVATLELAKRGKVVISQASPDDVIAVRAA